METIREKIQKLIEQKIKCHQQTIEDTKKKIQDRGYVHALEWNLIEDAAYAEHMIRILEKWKQGNVNIKHKADWLQHVNHFIKKTRDELCGDPDFGLCSIEGPWMVRSTSAGSGRSALIKANALREEYKFLHDVRLITEEDLAAERLTKK